MSEKSCIDLDDVDTDSLESTVKKTPTTNIEPRESVQVYESFNHIEDFLKFDNIVFSLLDSFVFLHKKKNWCNQLFDIIDEITGDLIELEIIQTHSKNFNKIISQIEIGIKNNKIIVIDVTKSIKNLEIIIISLLNKEIKSLWVIGHISDIESRVLSLFDSILVYDMPKTQFDTLREVIPLSTSLEREMRKDIDSTYGTKLLVYVDTNRVLGLPLLDHNPFITHQGKKDIRMLDYQIVLTELTKFVFKQLPKWLPKNNEDKESNEKQIKSTEIALDKDKFDEYYNNDRLNDIINETYAKKYLYKMQSLVKQIETHGKNLDDLNEKKAELDIHTPPHINRSIERQEDEIQKKSIELTDMLSEIYERKIILR